MKKITYVKFVLDLAMASTFVLLFNDRVLGGLTFHEIAGLGIGIAFITHVLLNVQWVKRVTMKLFDRKLPGKTRFGYLTSPRARTVLVRRSIFVCGRHLYRRS